MDSIALQLCPFFGKEDAIRRPFPIPKVLYEFMFLQILVDVSNHIPDPSACYESGSKKKPLGCVPSCRCEEGAIPDEAISHWRQVFL